MAIFLTKIPIKFFEESRKDSVMIFISTSGILQKSYEISSWNSARKSTFYKKWFWLSTWNREIFIRTRWYFKNSPVISVIFWGVNFLDLSQVKTLKYTGSWRPMISGQKILKEKSFLPSLQICLSLLLKS